MKKIILMACLLLPVIVTAQQAQPIDQNSLGNYIQVGLFDLGLLKTTYRVSYQSDDEKVEFVKDEKDKEMKFKSIASVFNYFETQGFEFVMELNLEKLQYMKALYLFRKK